ncbi:MAG TPA: hypothetical protein QGF95_04075 [Candidatus Latescibacteria bacterium]|nr:hypothetical protein [Candidatus Latescibacterota bacterium]
MLRETGWRRLAWVLAIIVTWLPISGFGQDYGSRLGQIQRGGEVSFEPTGPGVLLDALDPAVRKWYVPQELYAEYRWKQQEYSNYARHNYQRYVRTSLEGDYFYDLYGNFVSRGWLIYDWQQVNPQPFGSTLTKTRFFDDWFNDLVVASDHKGQYHYAITVGNEIRSTLTPMTFSKPLFNGIQWDFSSDRHEATLLLSRISDANSFLTNGQPRQETDNTNLVGGRVRVQVGDFVRLGGTFVNAHHSYTRAEAFTDDIFRGDLLGVQNEEPVGVIQILIEDDSPEDGEGGGALFASDILIRDLEGEQTRGSEIGFRAIIEGGFQRRGFVAADGTEQMRLTFDLGDPAYTGPEASQIRQVTIELVVANDYRISMASDRQLDLMGSPVFLPVSRAPGNVKDGSNQRVLSVEYGLPTANQIAGFTLELTDLAGFTGYAELNVNHRFRQYPNPRRRTHYTASDESQAWILNLSRVSRPWFGYIEAYGVDAGYTTAFDVVDETGNIDYARTLQRYEFVDDNDDQDRRPDWRRKGWGFGDLEIFPGWDENNDFVSDFNQNDNEVSPNRVPDYDEPFLRFHTDRPDLLYGVDMNHNGWVDRFENDEVADYPYRSDRKGYNVYGGLYLHPDVRLTIGRLDERQLVAEGENSASYLLLTADHQIGPSGRLRLFQDLRRVHDSIADDLVQWLQLPNTRGDLVPVLDPLAAPDTWINTTWIGWKVEPIPGLRLDNKAKWQFHHQLDEHRRLVLRGLRDQASFLGLVNKAEYRMNLGSVSLIPAWKSELLRRTPVLLRDARQLESAQLLMVLARVPVMHRSFLEGGLEYEIFTQLRNPRPPGAEDSFRGTVAALQLGNISDYLGYRLTTLVGLQVTRRHFEIEGTQTNTRGFLTVYAGVEP